MKNMFILLFPLWCGVFSINSGASVTSIETQNTATKAQPTLTIIDIAGDKTQLTSEQLLQHPALVQLTLDDNPVYPNCSITYSAVPARLLFDKSTIKDDSVIQFRATDGFSAPLPQQILLNSNAKRPIAFIAVEDQNQKWPIIDGKNKSAGPFLLIWKNVHLSLSGAENWPYQLVEFEVKDSFVTSYPNVIPGSEIQTTSDVYLGFQSFVNNCFACHKMNKEGKSDIGPDLNVPMNPTEYFKEEALKKLIRNPASVRFWSNQLMSAFDESMISDDELEKLIRYLAYMRERKVDH